MRLIDYEAVMKRYKNEWKNQDINSAEEDLEWLKQCLIETTTFYDSDYEFDTKPSPCTFCVYNPPSSFGAKPCTICPAQPFFIDSEEEM